MQFYDRLTIIEIIIKIKLVTNAYTTSYKVMTPYV